MVTSDKVKATPVVMLVSYVALSACANVSNPAVTSASRADTVLAYDQEHECNRNQYIGIEAQVPYSDVCPDKELAPQVAETEEPDQVALADTTTTTASSSASTSGASSDPGESGGADSSSDNDGGSDSDSDGDGTSSDSDGGGKNGNNGGGNGSEGNSPGRGTGANNDE